ncbi:MAG: hypothetical protein JWR52_2648 [Marmoricola sp.]|nr:hypothetical protein [Marmoricola sp.]
MSNAAVQSVLWGSGTYLPEVEGSVTPNMDTFLGHISNSAYFSWLSEYDTPTGTKQSIGPGWFAGRTTITPSPSASTTTIQDSTVQAELGDQISAGHLPAPVLDATGRSNTVYALFFPNGTTVCSDSNCSGSQICAYHGSFAMTLAGHSRVIRYLVLPHPDAAIVQGCSSLVANTPLRILQSLISHELIETITDPDVNLVSPSGPQLSWYDPDNGEAGDICVYPPGDDPDRTNATITGTDGLRYVVQRIWSNARDACTVGSGSADRTPPHLIVNQPHHLFQRSARITTTYHATDSGGVANYDVEYRVASWNGSFSRYRTVATATRATTETLVGRQGHEYCVRIRARDNTGNLSPWSNDRCGVVPLDDRALRTAGPWRHTADPQAYDRTLSATRTKGASLVLRGVHAQRIALLVTTCRTCGRMAIYLNGVRWQVASTYSAVRHEQVFVLPPAFTLRTVTVTVRALTAHRDIIVDGLAIAA